MARIPSEEAVKLILSGRAPAGIETGVLPLSFTATRKLITLPPGLRCYSLSLADQSIESLPPDLQVEYKLDLTNCRELTSLPDGLRVSTLVLTNCARLTALPERLTANFLQLDGCAALQTWPESVEVTCGWVRARDCTGLEDLPEALGPVASLDLRGCRRIERVPERVKVLSWIDIGGTRITRLPDSLSDIALRWRGVPITRQIAFAPETLTGPAILAERNAEVRRVMIERVGFERFVREVKALVLDTDTDRGGERKLLRVNLDGDEPMVLVSIHCPSTGRQYLVRVPPTMRKCRQAVAWTAGFDNPDDYEPIAET
jgi:hypothetical protein